MNIITQLYANVEDKHYDLMMRLHEQWRDARDEQDDVLEFVTQIRIDDLSKWTEYAVS